MLEFALAGSFIFVPMIYGISTVGLSMARAIQVIGLSRDAGHMFATGLDFSQAANRNLLLHVASGMSMADDNTSNGVVILSEIDGTGNNQAVISKRFVIGNAALRASSFGTPANVDSGGNVTNLSDPSANASSFITQVMPMAQGDVAYVAEVYFSTSDYDVTNMMTHGIYSRSVF